MPSTDMPDASLGEPVQAAAGAQSARLAWARTALTIVATATAVLFVSFLAVVAGLA